MASGAAKKRGQSIVLNEIKSQLLLQAERWGRTDFYSPVRLEEYELEACEKIRGQFLAEKANLEYELHMLDSDKRDAIIKIERLDSYIKRAQRTIEKHQKNLDRIFTRKYGEAYKALKALKRIGVEVKAEVDINN